MMYWHNNASRTYRAGKQGKDAMLICTPVTDDAEATYSCACHSPAFARLNAVIEQRLSRRAFLAGGRRPGMALWPKAAVGRRAAARRRTR